MFKGYDPSAFAAAVREFRLLPGKPAGSQCRRRINRIPYLSSIRDCHHASQIESDAMRSEARIVSASRRTDIPAFYTPWFMNRVRAGFCMYPNPMYPHKFYRVGLRPQEVLGIVFWTRHAAPLISRLPELDRAGFAYYFQYTIVGYPGTLDPQSPHPDISTKTFCDLSRQIGIDRIIWRYDPIVLSHELTVSWHKENFLRIVDNLAGATNRLVVSVIDPYVRTQRRVGTSEDGVLYNPEAYTDLLHWIAIEASSRKLSVQSCAEAALTVPGITSGTCIDAALLCSPAGRKALPEMRLHKQREGCLCHHSVDIGVNDSCGFGCQYCYATTSHARARESLHSHKPEWTCINQDVHIDILTNTPEQQLLL
ncbi:MAG: DUF1848 domain-containing protein [bacterium]